MPKKLILFPFGGNAREAVDVICAINRKNKEWDLLGFIDDDPKTWDKSLLGIKVLGNRELLKEFPDVYLLAVVGRPDKYLKRQEILEGLEWQESRFAKIIHPTAQVSDGAVIGYNTLLMANTVVSCEATIGNHCVILPNTVISHDSVIEDYCCIGSNVSISGNVTIKKNCYIGSGTSVRDDITIGEKTLVGIGSNVVENIEAGCVVAGNPAKEMRKAAA